MDKIKVSVLAAALLIAGVGASGVYAFEPNAGSLTDDQKAVFEKMHELRMAGDNEGAQALAHEMGFRGDRGQSRHQHRAEAQGAVDNNDYSAFQTAVAGSPMEDKVTPEIFAKMVEAHSLRNAGDLEGAREIMQGLGIGKGEGAGMGGERKGMMKGGFHRFQK